MLGESRDLKIITPEEYELGLDIEEDRSVTLYAYNVEVAEEITERIPEYYELMARVLRRTS